MPVVSVFSATHCGAEEVVTRVSERLGLSIVEDEITELAVESSGLSGKNLLVAVRGGMILSLDPGRERARRVAHLRAATARVLSREDVLVPGFAVLLVPVEATHVLRVCILANQDHRVERLRGEAGVSESRARKELARDDRTRGEWAGYLHQTSPWDQALYDLRIPMHDHSVEQAVSLVVDAAGSDALQPTPASRAAVADFALAAKVEVELAEGGHEARVSARGGLHREAGGPRGPAPGDRRGPREEDGAHAGGHARADRQDPQGEGLVASGGSRPSRNTTVRRGHTTSSPPTWWWAWIASSARATLR